jgi:deoxyhypusine synthase
MATEEGTPIVSVGGLLGDDVASIQVVLKEAPLAHTNSVSAKPHIPSVSASAVLGESTSMPAGSTPCRGFDFNTCLDSSNVGLDAMLRAFSTTGFQASNLGDAVEQIKLMRQWRLSDTPWSMGDDEALKPPHVRKRIRARIFLGYTSNQISCGQREVIRYLVEHKMVDVLVTTAGGIEEDIIKCFQPTFMGDFKLNGRELRKKGINRIGNLLVRKRSAIQ